MKNPIVIIGIGEMAGVFARGLLRTGYPLFPVTRNMNIEQAATETPQPQAVLITVAEKDIQTTLASIPAVWQDKLILIQNELLPRDWQSLPIKNPTVISVWFEKKPGTGPTVLIPSPIYGPHAELLSCALESIGIATEILHTSGQLLYELVRKNLYILTTNIAGIKTGGTVKDLWEQHEALARCVAKEILAIQEFLTGSTFDFELLIKDMLIAFDGDPNHSCKGRSAPARLARALQIAKEAGIATPQLTAIASI